jgi:hypothetical protein
MPLIAGSIIDRVERTIMWMYSASYYIIDKLMIELLSDQIFSSIETGGINRLI